VGIRKENAGIMGTFNLNSFDFVPVLVICLVAKKVQEMEAKCLIN